MNKQWLRAARPPPCWHTGPVERRRELPEDQTHPRPAETIPPRREKAGDEERRFLEGPRRRPTEALFVARVAWEFFRGFRAFHFVGPCVTVFGSARFGDGNPRYDQAREVGRLLVEAGFGVVTGGGPGLMEGANRGAKEAGGFSAGANIRLATEEFPNAYLDRWIEFKYFFVRKVMLTKYSYAFIAMPGGLGTLDEVFETATLIQTAKIQDFPMVLIGSDYWNPLVEYMREQFVTEGAIDQRDLDRIIVSDSPEEAVEHIRSTTIARFGLRYAEPRWKRRRMLFER